MSYRRMRKQDLWEIYRRWQAGQSVSRIAANERRDRKTVRQYLEGFERLGLVAGQAAVERQRFYGIVESLLPARTQRPSPGVEQLLRYKEELRELINRKREPLKPKTAFTVVTSKYQLTVSYATFKPIFDSLRVIGGANSLCCKAVTSA